MMIFPFQTVLLIVQLQDKWLSFIKYSQENGFAAQILIAAVIFLVVGVIAMEKSAGREKGSGVKSL